MTWVDQQLGADLEVHGQRPGALNQGSDCAIASASERQQVAGSRRAVEFDDIDDIDSDNPQLCAEYVKEIYVYMMKLEVSHSIEICLYLCCATY